MELLKQVSPDNWQDVAVLRQLYDDLPTNPYCTNSKGFIYIRNKEHAIKHRYIQPNHPAICKWLWFDVDDIDALYAWSNANLPPPQLIQKNPVNHHAHIGYRIATPIGLGGHSSIKAMRYLANVQKGLREALRADKYYSGNLIKNPFFKEADDAQQRLSIWTNEDRFEEQREHQTFIVEGAQTSYTLAELADKIDLELLKPLSKLDAANDEGYGRNCTLFDNLRHIAYRNEDKSYRAIVSLLTPISESMNNNFYEPLDDVEVMHIVRSIARYCSRTNFTESHKAFSELQRERIQQRWGDNTDKRKKAQILKSEGLSCRKIAEQLKVGKSTVSRWLK